MPSVQLYNDLITEIPEFTFFDTYDREDYLETDISPLGQVGHWLNQLGQNPSDDKVVKRVCNFLNSIFDKSDYYKRDIPNDFGIYLFWALEYQTIDRIKPHLRSEILDDARKYLKAIDKENYRSF